MIKSMIIDDERLARQELRNALSAFHDIEILKECSNADDAVEKISHLKPDLLFLDIQMPGKDGFELLACLDHVPEVIFTTAFDEYATKAFDFNALDYLLKPINEERLADAIKKISNKISLKKKEVREATEQLGQYDQVFVKDGERCWFVQLGEIRLFESEGNYVRIFFRDNKPMILKSLNNLNKRLDNRIFFRANRKHIINLRWVDKIEPWFNGGLIVKLKESDRQIEISRRQAAKLKEMMSL